jgi:hypothetical protein
MPFIAHRFHRRVAASNVLSWRHQVAWAHQGTHTSTPPLLMPPSVVPGKPPRFTLVTDLDGTLVDPCDGTHAALRRFNALWEKHCADCRLVYSTGRSHKKFLELRVRRAAPASSRPRS